MSARLRILLVACLALCAGAVAPAAARAAFFPAESIDGPTPEIVGQVDVDVARDGGAAVSYLKRDGGVPHVFVARMVNGGWTGGERLDGGQPGPSSDPHVAVADGGRALASWINAGNLWASYRASAGEGWSAPVMVQGGGVARSALDMSIHGVGYAAFNVGGDVRGARKAAGGAGWAQMDLPLDANPGDSAGGGGGPSVVALADGTGLAAWEEVDGGGRSHVFARRMIRGERISAQVREVGVPSIDGRPGLSARNPDAGTDDDSSYGWIAFEQDFQDGPSIVPRAVVRRLVGSDYDPPTLIDGHQWGTGIGGTNARVDVNGREDAHATSETTPGAGTAAAVERRGQFIPIGHIDSQPSAGASNPVPFVAANGEGGFAWFEQPAPGVPADARARFWNRDDVLEGETPISNGDFGGADQSLGIDASSDLRNNTAIAFVQGGATDRRLVVAHRDRPPSAVSASSASQAWQRTRRPTLRWSDANDPWGPITYRIELSGFPVGDTQSTRFTPAADLPEGSHVWRIATFDRRGQASVGAQRRINIDATGPIARLRTPGTQRRGRAIRFLIRDDPAPGQRQRGIRTSGVASGTVTYGDGSRARFRNVKEVRHAYRRGGRFTARFVITDRAGNRKVTKLRITVR